MTGMAEELFRLAIRYGPDTLPLNGRVCQRKLQAKLAALRSFPRVIRYGFG